MANGETHVNTTLCGKCKIKVINAVTCKTCLQRFHYSCAKLMKNICIVDEKSVVCCGSKNSSATTETVINSETPDIQIIDEPIKWDEVSPHLFKYIIHSKDALIASLRNEISLLNQQVDIMKNNLQPCQLIPKPEKKVNQNIDDNPKTEKQLTAKHKGDTRTSKFGNQNNLDKNTTEIAIDKPEKGRNNDGNNQEWIIPKKKKNKPQPIVGSSTSSAGLLKAAPKKAHIHIYRLMPDTNLEEVMNHIKPQAPEATVQKLNSRHPENYSSFQVTVDYENRESVMDPGIWPAGTRLNRFFHLRQNIKPST